MPGVANGTSKNIGLGEFWHDLKISKAFLISLVFAWSLGLGFLTRISASRIVPFTPLMPHQKGHLSEHNNGTLKLISNIFGVPDVVFWIVVSMPIYKWMVCLMLLQVNGSNKTNFKAALILLNVTLLKHVSSSCIKKIIPTPLDNNGPKIITASF